MWDGPVFSRNHSDGHTRYTAQHMYGNSGAHVNDDGDDVKECVSMIARGTDSVSLSVRCLCVCLCVTEHS